VESRDISRQVGAGFLKSRSNARPSREAGDDDDDDDGA